MYLYTSFDFKVKNMLTYIVTHFISMLSTCTFMSTSTNLINTVSIIQYIYTTLMCIAYVENWLLCFLTAALVTLEDFTKSVSENPVVDGVYNPVHKAVT